VLGEPGESLGPFGINDGDRLPPKIRELISELQKAGFADRGGKGSHRNFVHPKVTKPITISGAPSEEAKHYQIRAVRRAIEESQS
jgi:predicted RNA binding protein YcfA (HicA-like mRNA interferase family)